MWHSFWLKTRTQEIPDWQTDIGRAWAPPAPRLRLGGWRTPCLGSPKKRDQDGWGRGFCELIFVDKTLMLLKFTNCLPSFKCKQLLFGFQPNRTCHEHDVSNFWPTQAQNSFAFANLQRNWTNAQEACKLKDYMSFMSGRNELPRRVIWIGLNDCTYIYRHYIRWVTCTKDCTVYTNINKWIST